MKGIIVRLALFCAILPLIGMNHAPVVQEPEDQIDGQIDAFYTALEPVDQVVRSLGGAGALSLSSEQINVACERVVEANRLLTLILQNINSQQLTMGLARRLRVENLDTFTHDLPEAGLGMILRTLITGRLAALTTEISRCRQMLAGVSVLPQPGMAMDTVVHLPAMVEETGSEARQGDPDVQAKSSFWKKAVASTVAALTGVGVVVAMMNSGQNGMTYPQMSDVSIGSDLLMPFQSDYAEIVMRLLRDHSV